MTLIIEEKQLAKSLKNSLSCAFLKMAEVDFQRLLKTLEIEFPAACIKRVGWETRSNTANHPKTNQTVVTLEKVKTNMPKYSIKKEHRTV